MTRLLSVLLSLVVVIVVVVCPSDATVVRRGASDDAPTVSKSLAALAADSTTCANSAAKLATDIGKVESAARMMDKVGKTGERAKKVADKIESLTDSIIKVQKTVGKLLPKLEPVIKGVMLFAGRLADVVQAVAEPVSKVKPAATKVHHFAKGARIAADKTRVIVHNIANMSLGALPSVNVLHRCSRRHGNEDMRGGVDRFNAGLDAAVRGVHTVLTPACASLNEIASWELDLGLEALLYQIELIWAKIEDALAPIAQFIEKVATTVAQKIEHAVCCHAPGGFQAVKAIKVLSVLTCPAGDIVKSALTVLNPLIGEIVARYNEVVSKILGPLARIRVALKYPTALTFKLPAFEADSCELIIPSAVDVLKVDYETFKWDLIDEFKIQVDLPDAGAGSSCADAVAEIQEAFKTNCCTNLEARRTFGPCYDGLLTTGWASCSMCKNVKTIWWSMVSECAS
jgi:hypothetical protein